MNVNVRFSGFQHRCPAGMNVSNKSKVSDYGAVQQSPTGLLVQVDGECSRSSKIAGATPLAPYLHAMKKINLSAVAVDYPSSIRLD